MNTDDYFSLGVVIFVIVILLGGLIIYLNQGSWDRFWTSFNKDKITAKDEVYQTGSVRVYKFIDDNTVCYLADKQGASTAIWCK